jgi:hypothetical protein
METPTSVNATEHRETIVDSEVPQIIEDGPSLPRILLPGFVEEFEKGIDLYKRFVSACYRLTRESHWINHGTKEAPRFSLQGPGAEALMNPLGISYDKYTVRNVPLDGGGGGYACWVEGYMESKTLRRHGYYIGYCDSRDPFFNARPGWKPETGHGDVQKSAVTNWITNGVTRLAGLRDPDPELLTKAGLDPNKIQTIDYGSGRTPNQSNLGISEPQLKRLWAKCKAASVSEQAILEKIQKFYNLADMPGTDAEVMTAIKRGDYDKLCEWADRGGKDAPAPQPGQTGKLV